MCRRNITTVGVSKGRMELSEKGAVLDVDVTSMLGKDWKVDEAAESAAKRDVEKGRKATPPAKGEEEGR